MSMKATVSEKGQVTISELKGKLTVNMVDAILFDSGKAEIKPDGLVVLGKVIEILKSVDDKAIRIEGHTDAIPISGSLAQRYPTNWELSAARAINVARYLQKQAINPAHLSAAGFGEFQPLDTRGQFRDVHRFQRRLRWRWCFRAAFLLLGLSLGEFSWRKGEHRCAGGGGDDKVSAVHG